MAFNRLLSQCRHARRDLTVNWNVRNSDLHGWSNQRPRLARVPIEKPLSLQRSNVLHHRCLAGEPEVILDFARARRDPFLALLTLNKIKNAFLPLRQHVGMIAQRGGEASSNEQIAVIPSEVEESRGTAFW